ncbi:RB-associated KRAB zinc finger protein-like [Anopheles funestus]|uniref:RB-associated KRAB zinc finger protein-like n=1 Tax=Anopheles funestus TaxID=62324 RepID=UPI0020C624A0|nr:RB-associated KRAB zinc finger protein-like [Anopheles funestus]
MLSVCRLCARWAKCVAKIDDLQLNNLQHAKDAVKQMFYLDLSCPPSYPNQVCLECVQYLEYSYVFHQQLLNAEKVFQTLQERDELTQRLLETKNAGDALQFAEMVEEESGTELPQQEANEFFESVDNGKDHEERNATTDEDESAPPKLSERVIEIKIEAIEELEIVSCPLETADTNSEQSLFAKEISSITDEDEDENHSPDVEVHYAHTNRTTKGMNETRRAPMAVTVPPEQKPNRTLVRNKCYVCYRIYGTEAELMSHLIKHNDLLPYRCRQCSTPDCVFEFRTNQALNKHLETHWYPFECGECRLRFKKKDNINDHLRNVHMFESWYTCKWCGLKFQELRKFRLHVAAHRNMKSGRPQKTHNVHVHQKRLHPYARQLNMCSYCNRFKHRSNCEQHEQYNWQTETLFKCTEISCSKTFNSFREWRRHMKKHFPNESVYLKRVNTLPESLRDPNTYPQACAAQNCSYVVPAPRSMFAHYGMHNPAYHCRKCKARMDLPTLRVHACHMH